jgi:hypothetical protein
MTYLLMKKDATQNTRMQAQALSKWKALLRDLELYTLRNELRHLLKEVESLKFSE